MISTTYSAVTEIKPRKNDVCSADTHTRDGSDGSDRRSIAAGAVVGDGGDVGGDNEVKSASSKFARLSLWNTSPGRGSSSLAVCVPIRSAFHPTRNMTIIYFRLSA